MNYRVGESGRELNRRTFLKGTTALTGGALPLGNRLTNYPGDQEDQFIVEASYYEKLPNKKIRCLLCPRNCEIDESERGYCGVRENRNGTYYSLVYSRPCTHNIDPIEKKPFFHFHPGSMAFSIATAGCNVNCKFCQNWQISQVRPEQIRSIFLPPDQVAKMASQSQSLSVAYTYSEPVIFFEYMRDTAIANRKRNVKNVVVTGGYIEQEPLKELCTLVDAIKVDLKGFTEDYYTKVVNGELKPVLEAMTTIKKQGVWLEIVYLVVPTLNDSDEELKKLCEWIVRELGPDTPIHFSRFHPMYLLKNLPPTPIETLEKAKQISDSEGLYFPYIGNVPGHRAEDTYCPFCKEKIIERSGYRIHQMSLEKGCCLHCGKKIAGKWA